MRHNYEDSHYRPSVNFNTKYFIYSFYVCTPTKFHTPSYITPYLQPHNGHLIIDFAVSLFYAPFCKQMSWTTVEYIFKSCNYTKFVSLTLRYACVASTQNSSQCCTQRSSDIPRCCDIYTSFLTIHSLD